MEAAGIVLAGGRSSRMGTPKANLDWHGATLLHRAVHILGRVVTGPVVVVRADDQDLPELPAGTQVVTDAMPGLGPLQGLATGLAAVGGRADVAFVCATDLPFLHPAYVERVLQAMASGCDAVVPHREGRHQPLAAAYRTHLTRSLEVLIRARRLSFSDLLEGCAVTRLDERDLLADGVLAAADPHLDSLVNVNTPMDYADARARPAPSVTVTPGEGVAPSRIRAATLAEAAAAVGRTLDHRVLVTLGGRPIAADGTVPLVRGDEVAFATASEGDQPSTA